MSKLIYKVAETATEFERIYALNYRTFVEEIPQHSGNGEQRLIDHFDNKNTYAICLDGERLAGMLAMNDLRPFSLDGKLDNLDKYLPAESKPVEVRLLAIEQDYRHQRVIQGLLGVLADLSIKRGWNHAVISGLVSQSRLYRHLGFTPFGPVVGKEPACFQPMQITFESFSKNFGKGVPAPDIPKALPAEPLNLLPGPVAMNEAVRQALAGAPISHRSAEFMKTFQSVRTSLCRLTGARHVEIFTGSGTLANDVIAGQISLLAKPGIILSNGEFGDRLIDHGNRWRLEFKTIKSGWGEALDLNRLQAKLKKNAGIGWVWLAHCETSSGIVNELEELTDICHRNKVKVCLDAMSSLNIVKTDLSKAYLASATSGKGLASFPGLSMVFYNHRAKSRPNRLPRCLDLGYFAENDGVPFTISSNLVHALEAALKSNETSDPTGRMAASKQIRNAIEALGLKILGDPDQTSPAVITIELPRALDSLIVGERLEQKGCWLSYRSGYLIKRNLIQICLMGSHSSDSLDQLASLLEEVIQSEAA